MPDYGFVGLGEINVGYWIELSFLEPQKRMKVIENRTQHTLFYIQGFKG